MNNRTNSFFVIHVSCCHAACILYFVSVMSEYPQRRYVYVRVFILFHILRMYVFIFYASAQHKIHGLSFDTTRSTGTFYGCQLSQNINSIKQYELRICTYSSSAKVVLVVVVMDDPVIHFQDILNIHYVSLLRLLELN